jgi:hypothetical protein
MFVYVRFGGYGIGISTRGAILIIEDYKSTYTGADSEQGKTARCRLGARPTTKQRHLDRNTKDLALSPNLIFLMSQVQNALSKEHKIGCLRGKLQNDPTRHPSPRVSIGGVNWGPD